MAIVALKSGEVSSIMKKIRIQTIKLTAWKMKRNISSEEEALTFLVNMLLVSDVWSGRGEVIGKMEAGKMYAIFLDSVQDLNLSSARYFAITRVIELKRKGTALKKMLK